MGDLVTWHELAEEMPEHVELVPVPPQTIHVVRPKLPSLQDASVSSPLCCILPEASSLASIRPLYSALLWALQYSTSILCSTAGGSVSDISWSRKK